MSFFVVFMLALSFLSNNFGVSARFSGSLAAPDNLEGVHLRSLDVIATCWRHLPGATKYEVQTVFPDLTTESFNVSQPGFVLQNVEVDTYKFQVRQWSGVHYSRFSNQITVDVQVGEENTTESMNYTVSANGNSTFTWADSPEFGESNNCYTYTMEVCIRIEQYNEFTTNESLVSDVRILDHFNEETNRTETLYLKQHTIYYDQPHRVFIGYANVSCQVVKSDEVRFNVKDLVEGYNYTYLVSVYQRGDHLGILYEGVFVGIEYVAPVVITKELVSPLGVYMITCGILILLLVLSFAFSMATGWDRVINDVAVKKDKMRKKKEGELDDVGRGKLLTEGYITEQAQEGFAMLN